MTALFFFWGGGVSCIGHRTVDLPEQKRATSSSCYNRPTSSSPTRYNAFNFGSMPTLATTTTTTATAARSTKLERFCPKFIFQGNSNFFPKLNLNDWPHIYVVLTSTPSSSSLDADVGVVRDPALTRWVSRNSPRWLLMLRQIKILFCCI